MSGDDAERSDEEEPDDGNMPDTGLRWSRCSRSSTWCHRRRPPSSAAVRSRRLARRGKLGRAFRLLADRDTGAVALSFRGHGDSPAWKPLRALVLRRLPSTTSTASPAACGATSVASGTHGRSDRRVPHALMGGKLLMLAPPQGLLRSAALAAPGTRGTSREAERRGESLPASAP